MIVPWFGTLPISCVSLRSLLWSYHGSAHYLSVVCQSCLSHDRTILIAYQFRVNAVRITVVPLWPVRLPISSVSDLCIWQIRCANQAGLQCPYHCESVASSVSILSLRTKSTIVSRLSVLCQSCPYNIFTIVSRCLGCQFCVNLACTMSLPLCPGVPAVSSVSILPVQCLYHCVPAVSSVSILPVQCLYHCYPLSRLSALCQSCLYNVSTIVSRCLGCKFCVNRACTMSLPSYPAVPVVSSVSILHVQCIYHCVPVSRLSVLCQSCLCNI